MCSIGEDDFGDDGAQHGMEKLSLESTSSEIGNCKKCDKLDTLYKLRFREAECRECFLLYCRHKFRATLGSSKKLPRCAKVLLVFDGTAEAVALLDMLYHAQTANTFKRLHCTANIVHIDDLLEIEPLATTERYHGHLTAIRDLLQKYDGFDAFIISQRCQVDTLLKFEELEQYKIRDEIPEIDFRDCVDGIRSLTSKQDYIKYHRSHLIAAIAKQLNCTHVFLPDIATSLAAQMLSDIALGRGGSVALDVGLLDDRLDDGVTLLRPIKDLNIIEIQLYLKARNLTAIRFERFGESKGSNASIQNLTQNFVDNLQNNYASTVSTVFRTGDKIAPNRASKNCCSFCKSSLDYMNSDTLLAVEFSSLVSKSGASLEKCNDLDREARLNLQGELDERMRKLCHACRNIQLEINKSLLEYDDYD